MDKTTENNFSIGQTARLKPPTLPYKKIKEVVLGSKYELSLVFIGHKLSRDLNFKYRKKDKPTNVLSFPLSETEGEIFIDLRRARDQARSFNNRSYRQFVGFLFIHGLLHLKGMEHGVKMDRKETELTKKFGL